MKRALHISSIIILIAGTIFLLAFTDQEHRRGTYKSFSIEILNPSEVAMITSDEINELVINNFGTIKGSPILKTDLYKLETLVGANPYVAYCEVFQTIGGGLVLKAKVREPLVRIINLDNQQFYLDRSGYAIPVNPAHPSHVIVANGLIGDRFVSLDKSEKSLNTFADTSVLRQIYPVAFHIAGDEFLGSFIDQIYINERHEMELVPKIGSQSIIFGNSDDAAEKLENLKSFYQKVMSKIDWNTYKTISLKYKNQVVCTKKQ
jgi:cell division protein FtsQ